MAKRKPKAPEADSYEVFFYRRKLAVQQAIERFQYTDQDEFRVVLDPKFRIYVNRAVVDLAKEYPQLEFEGIPGATGGWPTIRFWRKK